MLKVWVKKEEMRVEIYNEVQIDLLWVLGGEGRKANRWEGRVGPKEKAATNGAGGGLGM